MELFRRLDKLFPVWGEALACAAGGASQVKTKTMETFRRLDKLFHYFLSEFLFCQTYLLDTLLLTFFHGCIA